MADHRTNIEIRRKAVLIDGQRRAVRATGMLILRKLADRQAGSPPAVSCSPRTGSDAHAVKAAIAGLRARLHDPALVETAVKRGYHLAT